MAACWLVICTYLHELNDDETYETDVSLGNLAGEVVAGYHLGNTSGRGNEAVIVSHGFDRPDCPTVGERDALPRQRIDYRESSPEGGHTALRMAGKKTARANTLSPAIRVFPS